ncbi:MAG TPA: 4-hydroxythreonine-4-phosphate dehydrogenase PdxA [Polyangiaceae bacterium]|nr:4-hydroxythreonine-4-phosphate dehydrogenase PdxA [Polyangiaceae bacterium]
MPPAPSPLALSVGCPSGIGPEIAVRAAALYRRPLVLVGDRRQLLGLARARGVELAPDAIVQPGPALAAADRRPGRPSPAGGAAQLAWVDAALDLVRSGRARALVTGPVSKAAIAASGAPGAAAFRGHTEHLRDRSGAREVVMAFWSPRLVTSLVTTHLPLARVPRAVRPEGVASAAFWLAWLLGRLRPQKDALVAVAALNPHAGEGGLLGDEEATRIAPALALAERRAAAAGLRARFVGPVGAETAFRRAREGRFGGVVAMYHDQATIALKLTSFGDAVNVSLGLPFVRTSVDHGTGYDIAGRGEADPSALVAALRLADRLEPAAAPRDRAVRGAPVAGAPRARKSTKKAVLA